MTVMDIGTLGVLTLNWEFISGLASIILINIVLSGDNAVVIAMAVRSLPREKRQKGILLGTAGAVILRIILTFFVARFLQTPYLKLGGGLILIWLAAKLFADVNPENDKGEDTDNVWKALKIIVIADATMSLDNILGVGAASKGNFFLLFFGLVTSIPIMVFTSNLLSMLMDKYPIIIYVGAGLLGKVGAEMIMTDAIIAPFIPKNEYFVYLIEGVTAIGVIIAGKLWARLIAPAAEISTDNSEISQRPKSVRHTPD
jgi:YjbE family integral membrane protein